MLDLIAKFFLTFGRVDIMFPLALWGFIFQDKNKWIRIIYITLFATIFVAFLKSMWKMQLAPWLNITGSAFPSGHMFVACIFYLQISREMQKRWITNLACIILFGEAYGLLEQKYHIMRDIIGAIGFAIPSLYLYNMLIKHAFFQNRPELLIIILLPLAVIFTIFLHVILPHILYTLAGMMLFGIVVFFYKKLALRTQNNAYNSGSK